MPVIMSLILWTRRDPHENEHHDIRQEIGKRMHGIGNHRATVSQKACHKLERQQANVHKRAEKGDSRDLPFPPIHFHRHTKTIFFTL